MIALISCGKTEKEFDEQLLQARITKAVVMIYNATIHDAVLEAWHDAIFNNKTPSGRYAKDFNDALEEVKDSMDKYGFRDSLNTLNERLLNMTANLNPPPSSRKECYDEFVEMVSDVSNLTRKVVSISGSYKSYSEETGELFDDISQKDDKFKIKYGNILLKADNSPSNK